MLDATSLTPPSPGLSPILLSNERIEPYSPKGPENVKITTLYREDFLGPPHGTTANNTVDNQGNEIGQNSFNSSDKAVVRKYRTGLQLPISSNFWIRYTFRS